GSNCRAHLSQPVEYLGRGSSRIARTRMKIALFRRRCCIARNRARFYRPLMEQLESRELLAFDLTISSAATANVSSVTASGTTTFTATGSGANLNVIAIDTALGAGNVVVSSGSGGSITNL